MICISESDWISRLWGPQLKGSADFGSSCLGFGPLVTLLDLIVVHITLSCAMSGTPSAAMKTQIVNHEVLESASVAARYARAANVTPHLIVTDSRENIIYANAEFLKFTGFCTDEVYGRKCNMLQVSTKSRPENGGNM